jgi:hypothetical protein
MRFRIGVHVGDMIVNGANLCGDNCTRAPPRRDCFAEFIAGARDARTRGLTTTP